MGDLAVLGIGVYTFFVDTFVKKEIGMASIQKPQTQLSKTEQLKKFLNPIVHIQQELDKALHGFYDLFDDHPRGLNEFENIILAPAMDLVEDKDCYKIEIEMPGLDEKDIKIALTDNVLNICGQKTISRKDHNKNYICREISYGKYDRSIALPQSADANQISASFKKGMLWITIGKKQSASKCFQDIKIHRID